MLNSDYKEMLSLFLKNEVEFMLIGAYALAYFGFPRATGDIDFFVHCTKDNSRKIYQSLVDFGAPVADLEIDYFATPGNLFQIGVAPCRIDILNNIDGVEYRTTEYEVAEIEGLKINIISKKDFIKNKQAAGRYKDLADIEYLENNS